MRGVTFMDLKNAENLARWVLDSRVGRRYPDLRDNQQISDYRRLEFEVSRCRADLWAKHMAKVHAERKVIPLRLRKIK